jgi:hypothetical protein
MRRLLLGLGLLLLSLPALGQALVLRGLDGRELTITPADIAGLPRHVASGHGADPIRYEGVLLATLLERVGVTLAPGMRGPGLTVAVVATGADGYPALFALTELLPGMKDQPAILADRRADGPLPPEDGSFRLVFGGDRLDTRSVHHLARIELVQLR